MADLALRALELTPPAISVLRRPCAVAAAAALTAAWPDQAARITITLLAQPLPLAAEDRVRCALSSVLRALRPDQPCPCRSRESPGPAATR